MASYSIVYGDGEQVIRETFRDIDDVEREDGWTVLFRGGDAILRLRDVHVQAIDLLSGDDDASYARSPTVGDLMRPAVTTVERGAHLAAAAYLMRRAGDSAVVVISDDEHSVPLAVVTDTDVANAVADGKNPNDLRLTDLVQREPITVTAQTSLRDAAERMVAQRIRHLPVVDHDRLVGMIDISDACRGLVAGGSSASTADGRQ